MQSYRLSLAAILATHADAPYDRERRVFIERVASALCERHHQFDCWPESVRHFYACYDLNFQVGNGGFPQAAYNIPHLIPIAQQAFALFGRLSAAELCQRAIDMLPAEHTAYTVKGFAGNESLSEVFAHFSESKMAVLDCEQCDEFWVDDALQELVERNREDFMSVDKLG